MYYHDHRYRRQRHHERMAQMREDYRRAQPAPRHDEERHERWMHVRVRSMWQWMRHQAIHESRAHRA